MKCDDDEIDEAAVEDDVAQLAAMAKAGERKADDADWIMRYEPIGQPVPATGMLAVFHPARERRKVEGPRREVWTEPVIAWVLCKVREEVWQHDKRISSKRYLNQVCGLVRCGSSESIEVAENLGTGHLMHDDHGFAGYIREGETPE